MSRLTFGMYKAGVRTPALTLASAIPFNHPTPISSAQSSISRYHREGYGTAMRELERAFARSDYWGPSGTPQARGWARQIVACLQTYHRLAAVDGRPVFAMGLNLDYHAPPIELGVHVDIVLLDAAGYVGRLVLWDVNALDHDRAILYASPVWAALEDDLGVDRVLEVEVWHLRSGAQERVTAAEAVAALPRVNGVITRMV